MPFRLKIRLLELGKKQKELLPELEKRGIKANPAEVSNALNGTYSSAKFEQILSAANEIVTEWEKEAKRKHEQIKSI